MKKLLVIALLLLAPSLAYAGVKNLWQNSGNSYGATCSSGELRTITTENGGMICTHDGHRSKCNRGWSIKDAASWACAVKDSPVKRKKTFRLSGNHNVMACMTKSAALPAELALGLGRVSKVKEYVSKGACFLLTGDKEPQFEVLKTYNEKVKDKSFVIYYVANTEYAGQKAPAGANFYIADFLERISPLIH